MRLVTLVCLLLFAAAIAQAADDGYKSAFSAWKQARARPDYRAYQDAFADANNKQQLDTKDHCYEKSPYTTVSLVLIVSADGRIANAFTDNDSAKAKCFKAAYLGLQMPIPLFSPFPVRMRMQPMPRPLPFGDH